MSSPIVFIDIAGPDSNQLSEFYNDLFSWEIGPDGSFSVDVASSAQSPSTLLGSIRKDPQEKILYIGVDDVAATLAQIVEQGGEVDQQRFEVPGVVVLGLFRDPAGNRMGLVEMEDGKAKVP
jgi:predicted enzyme related to lactoylglutathione lyase